MRKKTIVERVGHPAKKSYKKGDTMNIKVESEAVHNYPENKRLKKMQTKANQQYNKLKGTMKAITELHTDFTKQSIAYAKTLVEIEDEAKTPNFGER